MVGLKRFDFNNILGINISVAHQVFHGECESLPGLSMMEHRVKLHALHKGT